MMLKLSFFRTF